MSLTDIPSAIIVEVRSHGPGVDHFMHNMTTGPASAAATIKR